MIEVKELNLVLNKRQILLDVNINLQDGNIYGLVGNNGSGKTMLMKCICGLVKATSGSIIADGKKIGKDCDYLENAGIIIENPGFLPYYSGIKNLMLLAGIKHRILRRQVEEAMRICGLDPELRLSVGKYSLGMRQRLGIAQAIMENQHILILDEPMNGLDKEGVAEIRNLLLSLREKGNLILLASHNREDIEILCDEVYEVEAGRVIKLDKPEKT
ncbi:MAG: ATP-binding cassette domain-containing protein [Lachnospiraceae bacterium]|nr:ATP-binding cassette domain-containing protein [Lachnospiraceae bacterium]